MAVAQMAPVLKLPTLPTLQEFEDARKALADGFYEVECIESALKSYSEDWRDGRGLPADPPDVAYIGVLWRFVDDVAAEVGQLTSKLAALRERLHDVDCIGRDAEFRAEQRS